jgi:hypothetical protein
MEFYLERRNQSANLKHEQIWHFVNAEHVIHILLCTSTSILQIEVESGVMTDLDFTMGPLS